MFLYRDIDSFRDSCVSMCQFLLETLHNNDPSREICKEEMWSDIHLKLCNGDMDPFWAHPLNSKYSFKPLYWMQLSLL